MAEVDAVAEKEVILFACSRSVELQAVSTNVKASAVAL
jgi:hypothetical protein